MIEALEYVSDILGIIMGAALTVIVVIALIRTVIKRIRGESVIGPYVGVLNDLPCSITGINKHNDMAGRGSERAEKRTE